MKFKKLSSRLFRSLGAVTAVSLFAGLLVTTPTSANAAEDSSEPYSFSISSTSSVFYSDDVTPRISVNNWGNIPDSLRTSNNVVYVDVDTQKSFYVGGGDLTSWKIPRFFKEKSKHYQVMIAESINASGGIERPVSDFKILAKSNQVEVSRGKWDIAVDAPEDHESNRPEDVTGYFNYRTNQPLNRSSIANSDFQAYYGAYLGFLDSGAVISVPLPNYDSLTSGVPLRGVDENRTLRVQYYIAKRNLEATKIDQLEDVQVKSEVMVVPPRLWGVKITNAVLTPSKSNNYVKLELKLNRGVHRYTSKMLYVEDIATGKIVKGGGYSTSTGSSSFVDFSAPSSSNQFIVHIAAKDQSVQSVSELKGIVASSNQDYPQSLRDAESLDPTRGSRFQNGSNPSTADCQQQCYGDPVNALNGELFENDTDLQIEGAIGLNFVRSYSSLRSQETGPFGRGTVFSYGMSLRGNKPTLATSSYITVGQENGSTVAFTVSGDADGQKIYKAGAGVRATLVESSSGGYSFVRTISQDRFDFDAEGKLEAVTDRIGNRIDLEYSAGKLTQISNGTSAIAVDWDGELISSISDGVHTVSYEYASGNLTKVSNSQIAAPKIYSYSPDNRLQKITHPNGGSYETSYDTQGRVSSQKNPLGGITSFSYSTSSSNLISTITLPDGSKTRETYSAEGQLLNRVFAYGTSEAKNYSYTYYSTGEVATELLPSGKSITYRYDSRGNLTYISNPAGEVYRFDYNESNLLTVTTNPLGRTATNEYTEAGMLLKSVGYDGAVTSFEHSSKGILTAVQDPLGQQSELKTRYSYSGSDLLKATTDTRGKTTSYEYDSARNPSKITDALGNATDFSYANNNSELPQEILYPDGSRETFSYDGAGRKIKEVARDGSQTEYSYDQMDNLLSVVNAHGTTSYEYDSNQRLLATVNPKGARTEYRYSALGLVTEVKLPGGRTSLSEYNADGLLSAQKDAAGNRTSYGYDSAGRITSITDPASKVTSLSYGKTGNLIRKTLPSGNWTSYSYDSENRLVSTNEKDLRKISYGYDSNGNLLKTTYGDGSSELRSYDSENNLVGVTARDGKKSSYSYDGLNRLSEETRTDGTKVTNGYDSVGNTVSSDYGDGYIYENSYNLKGQLVSARTPEGLTTEYGYNPAGDLTSRGPPQSKVSYDYNSFGEITGVNYPSGTQVAYSYDPMGMLETVKSGADTLASYSYDSRYNLNSSSFGNGVTEINEFDGLNRLSSITTSNSGGELYKRNLQFNADSQISRATTNYSGGIKQDRSYQYNALGTISSVKDELTAKTQSFGYDPLNNLKTLGTDSHRYAANTSQLTSSTVEGINQSYSYDARGNRVQSSSPQGVASYGWSKSDQLSRVDLSTQGTASKSISYGYDAEGLLASRSSTAPLTLADQFSWDTASNSVPVLLEDSSYEYIYGAEATPLLQVSKSSGERTYLHGDERNSVVLATDGSGQPLWYRDYNEYGSKYTKTTASNASGSPETRFGYAGEYLDPDTGLYALRARWYDPKTAAFLSTDPAVLSTGESHAYASGNPLSYTDPLGLWSIKDTANTVAGAIDGFIGFPVASSISNAISPGSVDSCSALYRGAGTVAMVGSLFIPGLGAAKGIGLAAKGIGKVGQLASKAGAVASGGKKFLANIKTAIPRTAHPDSGSLGGPKADLVYRALAKGEDPRLGLTARAPGVVAKPISHVAGLKLSPWISTSKSLDRVRTKYDRGNGVVSIDLNKIDRANVEDISGGFGKPGRQTNYAKSDQEVLIRDHVPADAIVEWWK